MSTFGLDKNYQQFNFEEISVDELQIISGGSGGISNEAGWATSIGVSGLFLGTALAITAPVWGTALLLGASIGASALAINYAVNAAG